MFVCLVIEAATSSFLPILQGCVPNITSLLVSFSLFTKPFHTSTAHSITFFRLRSRVSAVTGLGHELPMPLALANNGTCRLHRLPATAVSRRRWRACPRPHRRHRPVGLSCAQLTPGRGTTTTPPAGFPTWCSWCNATKDLRLHQPAERACPPAPLSSKFLPALHSW